MIAFLVRSGLIGCIAVIVGSVAYRYVVLPRTILSTELQLRSALLAARIALGATALLALVIVCRLELQINGLRFAGDPWIPVAKLIVARTWWGYAWCAQVAAVVIAGVAFKRIKRGVHSSWWLAVLAAGLLVVTPAFSGHAFGDEAARTLLVLADILHVIGASAWLGTLTLVVAAGVAPLGAAPDETTSEGIASLITSFSPLAQVSAGVVVASGMFAAWIHLGSVGALVSSAYGRVLMLKLAAVAVVMAMGFMNWRFVTPRIVADGPGRLVRSARAEVIAGFVVLLITAVLIVTPQPMLQ